MIRSNCYLGICVALLGLGAVNVHAQQAAPAAPPPAEGPPAEGPPAEAAPQPAAPTTQEEILASPEVVEQAKQHFRQGVAFAAAGNCDGAVVEFEAAYKIIPRPNALYNIAQCEERLFRYDLAISYYERYLKEAPADAEDRPAVEAALKTLGNLLGILHVNSNVKAEVWIDDRMGGVAPGTVYVPAGGHSVELRAEGYIPKRVEVRLVGREEVAITVELDKAQTTVNITETTGISPLVFWIGAGATVVAASIGGVFALEVVDKHDAAEKLPPVSPERESRRKSIESTELTADIFFLSAGVLAIGTTVIAFMTDWDDAAGKRSGELAPPSAPQALRLTPVAVPGYAGLSLGGGL